MLKLVKNKVAREVKEGVGRCISQRVEAAGVVVDFVIGICAVQYTYLHTTCCVLQTPLTQCLYLADALSHWQRMNPCERLIGYRHCRQFRAAAGDVPELQAA